MLVLGSALAGAAAAGDLPWAAAGLSERQAAAHLLERFAFGARPGDVDRVVDQGLELWLELQLAARPEDKALEIRLEVLDVWSMDAVQMAKTFPAMPV